MNNDQLLKVVEQYKQNTNADYGDIKVIRIPNWKTVYVEQIDGDGRAVVMTECKINETTYWAGYSSQSQTVYISQTT